MVNTIRLIWPESIYEGTMDEAGLFVNDLCVQACRGKNQMQFDFETFVKRLAEALNAPIRLEAQEVRGRERLIETVAHEAFQWHVGERAEKSPADVQQPPPKAADALLKWARVAASIRREIESGDWESVTFHVFGDPLEYTPPTGPDGWRHLYDGGSREYRIMIERLGAPPNGERP